MVTEERFEFTVTAKKQLVITLLVGVVLSVLGYFTLGSGSHGHGHDHSSDHSEVVEGDQGSEPYGAESAETDHGDHHGHHGSSPSVKRLLSNLWINNVFFAGLAIIGVFFFAIQYAAQAGWSAGIKRIPLAFGNWLPIAFVLMLVVFMVGGHDIFHWTHSDLYAEEGGDKIVQGKAPYFFWPLEGGEFPLFWIGRLVIFFTVWFLLFRKLRSLAFSEDIEGGTVQWYKLRSTSAIFLVFFAVSSSMAAWDWVMSIDVHWFSTMFGWYSFASWWVAGLALTLFIVLLLKDKGYLSIVNANHIHDLGKFVFAFSVFWTYVWFSQFLLIYYAHIPEETVYFLERWKDDHYAPVFYINLIINFFFPFLVLMTRDAKRHSRILKVVCPAVVFGHWLDFYLMVSPGTVGHNGGFGFLEIGLILIYLSAFLFVALNALSKAPLFAKNHPMLNESLHHHI
ncbi:MAG: quinol:cytochrome C oxidoreductase [Ekhidna sp.]|nr:quinol:cytochrome C oxidoreductase [Ekhidna sp.]